MTEFFKSYPRNEHGEDFVVGDLHGQRQALLEENRQNLLHFESVQGQEFEPGVGLTFVGHSVVERPILYRSHLFVDTGAAFIPHGRVTVLRVMEVYRRLSLRGSMFAGTDFSQITIKYGNEDF